MVNVKSYGFLQLAVIGELEYCRFEVVDQCLKHPASIITSVDRWLCSRLVCETCMDVHKMTDREYQANTDSLTIVK